MAQEKYLGENGLKRLVGLVKEDLGTKANIDGSYDGLQAGSAKQIVSPTGITDTTPYVFRTTCGETSISGGDEQLATLKAIRGNTIAWNQLVSVSGITQTINGVTFTNNGDGSWTVNGTATDNVTKGLGGSFQIISGHTYLIRGCPPNGSNSTYRLLESYTYRWNDTGSGYIQVANSSTKGEMSIDIKKGTTCNNLIFWPNFFDLTQMFGAGNEPTSVLEFTRLFPKPYYPHNAGEPRNVKIIGLKSTGYNAFDGILEIGSIREDNGQNNDNITGVSRSKSYIKVVPGYSYTLEYPTTTNLIIYEYDDNNGYIESHSASSTTSFSITLTNITRYVRFAIGNNDITAKVCFHLTHSGSRTGYVPHEEHVLDIDTARYFPDGMNGVGTAYDELTPKVAIKRFENGDFGALNYAKVQMNGGYGFYGGLPTSKKVGVEVIANIRSPYAETISYGDIYNKTTGKFIARQSDGQNIVIFDDSKQNLTESEFKQAMSGIPFIYELAEPIVTEIPQVRDNHWEIKVDDYGTEEFLFAEGDEIPVPVGHETLYMDNLVDKLRNLPDPSEYQVLKEKVDSIISVPTLPSDTSKSYVLEFTSGTLKWTEKQQ